MTTPDSQPSEPRITSGAFMPDPEVIAAYIAALDIATELDLSRMLQRLVDLARHVIPSKYAAIGVADASGEITDFITSGISSLERTAIGPIPRGHGMLGALIRDRTPMMVTDIAADSRSVGFPPHHPPMRTLLGVPIMLGDEVLGNLYLTERLDQPAYNETDLQAVQVLATHAAAAIERARQFSRAEDNRRRAEERRDQLTVILNSLPSAVIIRTQPDGAIELANATARDMFGESLATSGEVTFLRDDGHVLPRHQWPGMRSLHGEIVRNRQVRLSLPDQRIIPVLAQSAPLRDRDGRVVRAVVVLQDITPLHEAEQLKDDFLSLVSHEFRTPLTAIHGGAQLLAQRGDSLDSATRTALLTDIVTESASLERMLANMLTLTAVQAGRLEPETEPVLVRHAVRQAVTAAKSRHPDHAYIVDIPEEIIPAEGDDALLQQVLRNLYENAAKYSPPGSTITTRIAEEDGHVIIRVTDEGSGIAPEHLDTVFERFRRPGADPTIRGMGLGLYLSRHLMAVQGGSIGVASPGAGKGATFFISLPVAKDSM